ncbi:helix-turn-helix transcriptional regulator [Streptacidiphilus jiangxiensis]|uniref:Regulatory protein, luxR family n=1 Tax=Streptacidiphilus jiangxiensis TaxID=235985 RepID=A0A1H7XMD9_STRJI|nr:LuxR family transcriptional regulator [Streptacidiphilus jiangxiensis]SEM34813.1 regulatory protein, luxR family [Streptacidiphilus jiangxiensis]
MLTPFGLTEQADRVYRLLLRRPGCPTDKAAADFGCPEAELTGALEELTRYGLLAPSWREDGWLHVVNPRLALDTLLAYQHAEIAERNRELARSQAAAEILLSRYTEQHGGEDGLEVEQFHGAEAVRARIADLLGQTNSESLAFVPGGAQTPEVLAASKETNAEPLARGVRMRTVYLDSIRNAPGTQEHARWLTDRGAEVRTVPTLPMRLWIADRELAMVPIDPSDSGAGAVLLRQPGAIAAFLALFEAVWASAVPFGETPRRSLDDPGSQSRELLRLLARGFTDEAAARRLGISLRSERRLITELMEKLDAKSRFQLGQRAAEHGFV